jgi:hypothetical protein
MKVKEEGEEEEEEEEEGEEEERGEAVTKRENCIMKCCIIWITAIKSKK